MFNLTLSSDAQKVVFVLCKNGAQRNAQNKGRFLGQLQRFVGRSRYRGEKEQSLR
jgi:hypothetical protein